MYMGGSENCSAPKMGPKWLQAGVVFVMKVAHDARNVEGSREPYHEEFMKSPKTHS